MDLVLTVIGSVLVVAGALVFVTAGLGLIRFPDPYTRISATGTAGGVGMILIVVGGLVLAPSVANVVKVALIVVLQLGSAAVATMALGRSAYPGDGETCDPEPPTATAVVPTMATTASVAPLPARSRGVTWGTGPSQTLKRNSTTSPSCMT